MMAISRASDRLEAMEAMIFGAGDLSASLRARVDPGDFWHHARMQVLTAAGAAGIDAIDAIDAPYPAYQEPGGDRRSAAHASLLGFDGNWAIHPGQVPIANEVFAPTAAEVAAAREASEIYRKAEASGVRAIGRDGRERSLQSGICRRGGAS